MSGAAGITRQHADDRTKADRWTYLWLVIGVVLLVLSTGRFSVAVAAWLAPVFLIRFNRSARSGWATLWTLLGILVGYGIAWHSILKPLLSTLPFYLLVTLFIGLENWLPYLADRWLVRRLKGFGATLVFPLAVTAMFFLNNLVNPLGSFGTVGYEQFSNRSLIQLVSITGLWGLTFLVSWLGPLVNWAWQRSFRWPEIRRGLLVYAAILGLVLVYGGLRLSLGRVDSGTVTVHGIDCRSREASPKAIADCFIEATLREAGRGAQIVIWGERAAGGFAADADAVVARAQEVARQKGIYLVIGLQISLENGDHSMDDRLLVIDPSGEVVLNHLMYGATLLSDYTPGDGVLQTVDTPFGRLTGVICWDADFPSVVRQSGRQRADILLVPSGDPFPAVAPMHAQQAIFRAIENGVSLVRQDSSEGLAVVADPYGRVLATTDIHNASERVMVAQVPTRRVFTVYSVTGDLFGWLSVAGFVGIAVEAIWAGRKAAAGSQ